MVYRAVRGTNQSAIRQDIVRRHLVYITLNTVYFNTAATPLWDE